MGIPANTNGERVQSSGSQSKMADAINKCVDMEAEIDRLIDELIAIKKEVIEAIEKIDSPVEYDLLHRRYIQFQTLQEIADHYGYDYGYDDYGDYGEALSEKELEHWNKRLMEQLDEREKQMFHKDAIMQKAKQRGKPMEGFGEKELYTATLMVYTDYKQSIGQNPDFAVKLAYDWLSDKDVAVKGAEKLAVYYDCIVEGE